MTPKKSIKQTKKNVSKARKPVRKAARKPGHPDGFSWPVAELVLDAIAGGQSLTSACDRDGLPSRKTVSRWVRKGALGVDDDLRQFAEGFVLACRVRVALLEDDFVELIRKIRDTPSVEFTEMLAVRFKIEMDGLKWYLGKFRIGEQLAGVEESLNRLKDATGEGDDGGDDGRFMMVVRRAEVADA